jgi:hypothetical protein
MAEQPLLVDEIVHTQIAITLAPTAGLAVGYAKWDDDDHLGSTDISSPGLHETCHEPAHSEPNQMQCDVNGR